MLVATVRGHTSESPLFETNANLALVERARGRLARSSSPHHHPNVPLHIDKRVLKL